MKKKIISIVKYILGLGLGLFLLYFALLDREYCNNFANKPSDLECIFFKIQDSFANANYFWVAVSYLGLLLSHWFRAARWKMLVTAAGHDSKSSNVYASLLVGYLANNAVPRLGEVTRCTMLNRSDKVPFAVGFGTVITSRLIDVVILISLIGFVLLMEFEKIKTYFIDSLEKANSSGSSSMLLIWIGLAVFGLGILLAFGFRKKLMQSKLYRKLYDFVKSLIEAILSLRKIKNLPLFLFHTFMIWFLYILMTYVVFFAFEETSDLSFYFAIVVTTMGGIGFALPVPGGIGPYHNAVIFTFVAFGLSTSMGTSYAVLVHTSQLIGIIFAGFIAYIYLMLKISKSSKHEVSEK